MIRSKGAIHDMISRTSKRGRDFIDVLVCSLAYLSAQHNKNGHSILMDIKTLRKKLSQVSPDRCDGMTWGIVIWFC